MSKGKSKAKGMLLPLLGTGMVFTVGLLPAVWGRGPDGANRGWERLVAPGPLSHGHAFLEGRCSACHAPLRGVEAVQCIVCHADARSVLQRQPTAFHASIGECAACHVEHGGREVRPAAMSHAAVVAIGLRRTRDADDRSVPPSRPRVAPHARISADEAQLDCRPCHGNQDRHQGLFGRDCAQCHGTAAWTIPEFVHPSASSIDCAQCHQAPPSHYMEHFTMVSMRVAGEPHARVEQCFRCHQTTAWNDIKRIGWYKHH